MKAPFSVLLVLGIAACGASEDGRWQGYVEGEYVRVAAAAAGRLVALEVRRGAQVSAGSPLFTLEQQREQAAVSQSSDQIAAVAAQVEQARAALALAQASYQRARELRQKGLVAQEQVDQARTDQRRAAARLKELEAQQQSAHAQRDQVQWQLTQKTVTAPVAGLVEDTIYQVGEWVPAGGPVVSLLPPGNRVVRFFVPEPEFALIHVGQAVLAHCDACGGSVKLSISYVSPQPEFTPPVIYSRESRSKLVFMVEARAQPDDVLKLNPGQPVEVSAEP